MSKQITVYNFFYDQIILSFNLSSAFHYVYVVGQN